MSEAQKRAVRTLIQAVIGALSVGGLGLLFDFSPEVIAVLTVVLTTVATAVMNALEDNGTIGSYLK
jgi:phage shock protein PspC (stress-responsive transcriptional regulator)